MEAYVQRFVRPRLAVERVCPAPGPTQVREADARSKMGPFAVCLTSHGFLKQSLGQRQRLVEDYVLR